MTREERKKAIEVLDDMKVKIDIPKAAKTQNDRNWALDVAIQTLSQEPCDKCVYSTKDGYCQYDDISETIPPLEPCDDAISRQYLLENCVVDKVTMPYVPISKIQEAPPVTPKSKTGHWIHDYYFYGIYDYICSECKKHSEKQSEFCPNCGAKMESEE